MLAVLASRYLAHEKPHNLSDACQLQGYLAHEKLHFTPCGRKLVGYRQVVSL